MELFESMTINELCKKITDGAHFSPLEEQNGIYPMYSSKDMLYNGFDDKDVKMISKTDYDRLVKQDCRPLKDDILIIKDGNNYLKQVFKVNSTLDAVILSSIAILRPNKKLINPDYFTYVLRTGSVRKAMANYVSGAAIPRIVLKDFKKMKLKLHKDLHIQFHIASILSAYDNLIENNNRRIRLLEQMAENLYKEWFVRFRFPGYEKFEFERGLPKKWTIKHIGELCETIGGGTPSTRVSEYWNGDIKWVTPSDITSKKSMPLLRINGRITKEGLKNSSARLLPPYTILMTSRASIGFFGIAPFEVCTNQGFISIIPHNDNLRMYMLYMLKSRKEEIVMNANGSTFLEISKTRFRKLKMLVPDNSVLDLFENKTRILFDIIMMLEQQNELLSHQRDLLLPWLMSGKLEVKG